jgi:hypothetical protein
MKYRTYAKRWKRYYKLDDLTFRRVFSAHGGLYPRYSTERELHALAHAATLLKLADLAVFGVAN